ncbi:hypothetical protein EV702DRAFT_1046327 [Suillus placidus]|uniref:Uncharacterized protein n=1 Tax=Suillus placidus TaxID=48579 RepID=A0A9P7D2L3_9AGAM|nr:hypothetical protein EV702DRAFT_1046327 [Suillus placidus]
MHVNEGDKSIDGWDPEDANEAWNQELFDLIPMQPPVDYVSDSPRAEKPMVAQWATKEVVRHKSLDHLLSIPGTIQRNGTWSSIGTPLGAIHTLLGNPTHTENIIYKPCKVFTGTSMENQIYSEMWMGKWWHESLPEGSVVVPVMIATNETQLTQFSGSKSAYPYTSLLVTSLEPLDVSLPNRLAS